ncbi:MAG: flippase-like domain-containing protein [Desulfobacterales bacterium]|nr:flippase-like domain-containing protein [Desulfobacterales bacterium]
MSRLKKNLHLSFLRRLFNARLVGVVFFVVILASMNLSEIWKTLQRCSWMLVGLAFIMQFASLAAKSARWGVLLSAPAVPFRRVFCLYLISAYFGIVTPAKIGEAWKAVIVSQEHDIRFSTAVAVTVIDRAMDIYLYLIMGLFSLLLLKVFILPEWVSAIILIVSGMPLTLLHPRIRQCFMKIIGRAMFSRRVTGQFDEFSMGVDSSLRALFTGSGLMACLITLGAAALLVVQFWLLTRAIGLNYPWTGAILSLSLVKLVVSLPISICGLGTREIALISVFNQFGFPASAAVGMGLLMLLVGHLGIAVIGLIVSLTQKPTAKNG